MDEIDEELKEELKEELSERLVKQEEEASERLAKQELPQIAEIKPKPKRKGASKERMQELQQIRTTKKQEKQELKAKADEILRIKKEKIEFEYEEAQRLKEAIEKKKIANQEQKKDAKEHIPTQKAREINNSLIKSISRDVLKEKYLEEAKKRVMIDLFSS